MENAKDYAYYKITRKEDNFKTYCTILNYVEGFFKSIFGSPDEWEESEEKAVLTVRNKEHYIPMRIEASVDDDRYTIELTKQEYMKIELKYF